MATKKLLIESAVNLFFQNGYSNTKVEDITHNAKVAKGTFYSYFNTKEDIFFEIFQEFLNKEDENLNEIDFETDLLENIRKIINHLCKNMHENTKIFRIVAEAFSEPELKIKIWKISGEYGFFMKDIKKIIEISNSQINNEVKKNLEYLHPALGELLKIYLLKITENIDVEACGENDDFSWEEHMEFISQFLYKILKK